MVGRADQPDPDTIYRINVSLKKYPIRGPQDALVTIVEFSDFQCPFCGRVVKTIHNLMAAYPKDVRLFFLHNPLPFHNHAMDAAEAACTAFRLGGSKAFWKYHDILYSHQQNLTRSDLEGYAKQIGVDPAKFKKALNDHTCKDAIAAQKALAAKMGARGTPAFFINGKFLSGARPLGDFKRLVEDGLIRAKKLIKNKKITASHVYDEMMKTAKPAP